MNPFTSALARRLKRIIFYVPQKLKILYRRCFSRNENANDTLIEIVVLSERDNLATKQQTNASLRKLQPLFAKNSPTTADSSFMAACNESNFNEDSKLANKSHVRRLFVDEIDKEGSINGNGGTVERSFMDLFDYDTFVSYMNSKTSFSFLQAFPLWSFYHMACLADRNFDVLTCFSSPPMDIYDVSYY